MELEDKLDIIITTVCKDFDVEFVAIRGRNRMANIRQARQVTAYFIKENTSLSLNKIGALIDKDHATIMHSVKVVKNDMKFNKPFQSRMAFMNGLIKTKING